MDKGFSFKLVGVAAIEWALANRQPLYLLHDQVGWIRVGHRVAAESLRRLRLEPEGGWRINLEQALSGYRADPLKPVDAALPPIYRGTGRQWSDEALDYV